jgi:hypothetical protein
MLVFGFVITLAALLSDARGQGPVVLYDPLSKVAEDNFTDADEALAKEKLVPRARARWAENEACGGGNLTVIGAVDGAFTRAGAKQRAILYELCQTGNGFANNGLAVLENGRVVAHFTEEGGWNLEVSRVSDLNGNGRDELVIETGGGMHQGYMGSSVAILEVSDLSVISLGRYLVYTNVCENEAAGKYCDRSYKLTATSGVRPRFFTQKYTNRGTDEKPRWIAAGKALAAKQLDNAEVSYEAVK